MCKRFYKNGGDNMTSIFNDYSDKWKADIRNLAKDFCIKKGTVEKIIRQVVISANTYDTSDMLYNKAWKLLIDTI